VVAYAVNKIQDTFFLRIIQTNRLL